jgi:hypothetical protein
LARHAKSHWLFEQTASAFDGAGLQFVQEAPQWVASLSATHAPPQLWNPMRQTIPHPLLEQTGSPFAIPGQFMHEVPQCVASVSLSHSAAVPHW